MSAHSQLLEAIEVCDDEGWPELAEGARAALAELLLTRQEAQLVITAFDVLAEMDWTVGTPQQAVLERVRRKMLAQLAAQH